MTEEATLLARCIARDQDAWREFIARYRAVMYSSILKVLDARHQSAERAEDIFQDILLKLLTDDCRALRRFEGRSRTSTWLARIAINAAIDAVRRQKAQREMPDRTLDDEGESSAEEVLKRIPVDARIPEGVESRELALRLLSHLEERDSLILKMYFYGGLKEREIAELLGMPLNSLSSRKARALEKLRAAASELLRVSSDGVESKGEPEAGSNPAGA